jgi:hypothetical protein
MNALQRHARVLPAGMATSGSLANRPVGRLSRIGSRAERGQHIRNKRKTGVLNPIPPASAPRSAGGRPRNRVGRLSALHALQPFGIRPLGSYSRYMPRKPIELPPAGARAFVRDMCAFFAAGHDTIKDDGIAARQLFALKQHYAGKLKLTDVLEMFLQMRDQVS